MSRFLGRGIETIRIQFIEVADVALARLPTKDGIPHLAEIEQRLLEATLRATKGNKTLTAKLLGIDPRTVSRKLERWDEEGAETEPLPSA